MTTASNGALGWHRVRSLNELPHVWQTSLHNPEFSKYAEICGALAIRVTDASQLEPALDQQMPTHDRAARMRRRPDGEPD